MEDPKKNQNQGQSDKDMGEEKGGESSTDTQDTDTSGLYEEDDTE